MSMAGNQAAFGAIGHGDTERMIAYPVMLWMLAVGGDLMSSRRADDGGTGRARPL